jgi:hypothetical protein
MGPRVSVGGLMIAGVLALPLVILLLGRMPGHVRVTRSPRETTPLDQVDDPSPRAVSRRDARGFAIAIGVACYALAIVYWVEGRPERSGKWAWLYNLFYQWLGEAGPAVLFALLGTLLIFVGARRR